MNYPELEDIFLRFGLDSEKSPQIKESYRVSKHYLERLVKAKRLSKSEANRIKDQQSEIELEARTIGFKQGFKLAVKLFIEN